MKKFLTYKIPSIYSFSIIGAIVVILVGYTAFKAGEIQGRYETAKEMIENKGQKKTSHIKARNIQRDQIKSNPIFNKVEHQYTLTDVQALISTKTSKDIKEKRKQLISFLWDTSHLPIGKLPKKINTNFYDKRYKHLYEDSLKKINHVLIGMEFNLQSNIYHFIPKLSNRRLVIFHQGHGGDFVKNIVLIDSLLKSGYSVAGFCMPLLGLNNKPKIKDPRFGLLKLSSHNHIKFLKPEKGHPIKYFLEPVVVFLNYASHQYKDISMIGVSGGAWTATLAAAVDNRILHSFPVAGSYPIYLRSNSRRDWGDYEQTVPELYRTCNYLELYILGSYGKGRSQLQIINRYDSCCFAGIKWKTYSQELKGLSEKLDEMDWDLFLDETHASHMISEETQSLIISILNKNK